MNYVFRLPWLSLDQYKEYDRACYAREVAIYLQYVAVCMWALHVG